MILITYIFYLQILKTHLSITITKYISIIAYIVYLNTLFRCKELQLCNISNGRIKPGFGCVIANPTRSKIQCNRSTSFNLAGETFVMHSNNNECKILSCLPRSMKPSYSIFEDDCGATIPFGSGLYIEH